MVAAMVLAGALPEVRAWDGRVEIDQARVPYTITNSGSYVVTEDLVCTSALKSVIEVNAEFVTIDLAGHVLTQQTNWYGIHATGRFITVRNGTVWAPATEADYAVYLEGLYGRVEGVRCRQFKNIGISTSSGSLIRDCVAEGGGGSVGLYGIYTGSGSLILDSAVKGFYSAFPLSWGFYAGSGVLLDGCHSVSNGNGGDYRAIRTGMGALVKACSVSETWGSSSAIGIEVGGGSLVADCDVRTTEASGTEETAIQGGEATLVTRCVAGESMKGVVVGDNSLVKGCVVENAGARGIHAGHNSLVRDCALSESAIIVSNGSLVAGCTVISTNSSSPLTALTIGAGCYVLENHLDSWGTGLRIDGNHNRADRNFITAVTDIDARGASNLVIRNRFNAYGASGLTNDFAGEVVTGSAGMANVRPWANVDH